MTERIAAPPESRRGISPRSVRWVILVCFFPAWSLLAGVGAMWADAGAPAPPPFRAPGVPAREATLDLFVRELQEGALRGETVRVVRYGQAGTLLRPGVLELPRQGRAFSLKPYDLVVSVERPLEIRRLPDYAGLFEVAPASMVIAVSESRFELLQGSLEWIDDRGGDLLLSLGDLILSGRGRVEVQRRTPPGGGTSPGEQLRMKVITGRFELRRGEELLAVLGSGHERTLDLPGRSSQDGPEAEAFARSREALETLLEEAVLSLYRGPLTGDRLVALWEAVCDFGPRYARAEARGFAGIPHPDEALRSLGEALRLLKAFSFRPAP
ncbi:hypothetical protein AU468_10800 [Alkalispirochaeta sphaeroplastigenens]|uniref:Uncharacterized protein n=1 Tax=Alkalispirochaeta sphaeroplastigenens TaxID=1187066 RepID=A0A2S4JHT7_9SPIO|nr:hypothetical protein [Alkalispirochaeta sphaeroplastigenens]POQ99096.1 hypothetical protein AU468_10800 [Alkalispirochaeta sphaeroplastigenens]